MPLRRRIGPGKRCRRNPQPDEQFGEQPRHAYAKSDSSPATRLWTTPVAALRGFLYHYSQQRRKGACACVPNANDARHDASRAPNRPIRNTNILSGETICTHFFAFSLVAVAVVLLAVKPRSPKSAPIRRAPPPPDPPAAPRHKTSTPSLAVVIARLAPSRWWKTPASTGTAPTWTNIAAVPHRRCCAC